MKGLKTLVLVSLVSFGFSTQAMKLDIKKKSLSIAHESIDKAEIESIKAEKELKEKISQAEVVEDGFDTIKVTRKANRSAASNKTYKKVQIVTEDSFEEATPSKDKVELPKSDSITTEEAVRQIDSEITNEFSDEISLIDGLEDTEA